MLVRRAGALTVLGMHTTHRDALDTTGSTVPELVDASTTIIPVLSDPSHPDRDALVTHLVGIFSASEDYRSFDRHRDVITDFVRCAPHDFGMGVLANVMSCSPGCPVRQRWTSLLAHIVGADLVYRSQRR